MSLVLTDDSGGRVKMFALRIREGAMVRGLIFVSFLESVLELKCFR